MAAADRYAERGLANFNVRVPDELATRFDRWAGDFGGRSAALRRLMDQACGAALSGTEGARLGHRPAKLTVRLMADDAAGLVDVARVDGLTPNAWAAALVRRRLAGRPTFALADARRLTGIQTELRRIGVNVNQIARALNTAVMEGRVLDTELSAIDALRVELRGHMGALREAFAGNLAYWEVLP